MPKTVRSLRAETVFVLLIFCIFAMSVLMVLMLGGSIYKNTAETSARGYDERTGLSYIWSKVKNSDEAGKVYTDSFYELSVLCLEEEYSGVTYTTMIYQYDGWIRELFSEKELKFHPEDGLPVVKAEALSFENLEDGSIKIIAETKSLIVTPRSRANVTLDAV